MTLSSVKNDSLSSIKTGHTLPFSVYSLGVNSIHFPFVVTSRTTMSTFCPFTAPVVTPPFSWRGSWPSMSFDADVYYLASLWGITLPRGEHCSQNEDRHLEKPKEETQKGHKRDLGKLLRRATAKTFRYAQRDSNRRHKDNTYIVLHDLTDDEYLGETRISTESDPDSITSASFRRSLSLKAERIIRRRRR